MPSVELKAGGDAQKRYFLVGPVAKVAAPAQGYRLLIILPGGDGSADFNPFIRRIAKNAVPAGYLVAQPVAIKWQPSQSIVWPIDADKLPGQKFSTEDFVDAVIADIERTRKLDPRLPVCFGLVFRRAPSVRDSAATAIQGNWLFRRDVELSQVAATRSGTCQRPRLLSSAFAAGFHSDPHRRVGPRHLAQKRRQG